MISAKEIKKMLEENTNTIQKAINESKKTMEDGFTGMQHEFSSFKAEIKKAVDDSAKATNERVDNLENELKKKDEAIIELRRDLESQKRKNNLILFNLPETEKSTEELMRVVIEVFHKCSEGSFNETDFNDIFRIGKYRNSSSPVLVSFVSRMKAQIVISSKQRFKEEKLSISRDYPKTIIEERKRLQPMITHLNQSGKKAYLIEDQAYVDGQKLSKEVVEEELRKYYSVSKRSRNERSPETFIGGSSRRTALQIC
jgi:hypothetical protein